jgi:hypothetical protein
MYRYTGLFENSSDDLPSPASSCATQNIYKPVVRFVTCGL